MPGRRARRNRATDIDASRTDGARQNAWPYPIPLQVRTKLWLERDGRFVIGEGGLRLLLEVEIRGSLLAAARQIGWSYRHAWQYLRCAEQVLGLPLVRARAGKGRRRGTMLTAEGRHLLTMLREARTRLDRTVGATGPTGEEIAARGHLRSGRRRSQTGRTM